jgi:hypothetical protein
MNLQEYLVDTGIADDLQMLILALSSASVEIAGAISVETPLMPECQFYGRATASY